MANNNYGIFYGGTADKPIYYQQIGSNQYAQINPSYTPFGDLNAIGNRFITGGQIPSLPTNGQTIGINGQYNGYTNTGYLGPNGAGVQFTGGQNGTTYVKPGTVLPPISGETSPTTGDSGTAIVPGGTSPFSSSSSPDIYSQMMQSLQQAMGTSSSFTSQYAQLAQLSGQAQSQALTAQQTAANAVFQQQAYNANQQGLAALGMTDVQTAMLNPTGTYSSPAGPGTGYASTAYTGVKAQVGAQYQQIIDQIGQAQLAYNQQVQAGQTQIAAQTMADTLNAAQTALQNQMNIMGQMFSVMEGQQNYGINMANYGLQKSYYDAQISQGQQSMAYQNANNIISAIQSSGKMTDAERQQLSQYATELNMPSLVDIGSQAAQAGSVTMAQNMLDSAYKQAQIEKINSDLGGGVLKSGGLVMPKAQISQGQQQLLNSTGTDGMVDPSIYTSMLQDWVSQGGLVQDFFKQFPTANFVINTNDPSLPGWVKTMYQAAEKSAQLSGLYVPFANTSSTTGVDGTINRPY